MCELAAYDIALEEGRIEGRVEGRVETAQRWLLRHGRLKFGEPEKCVQDSLRAITNFDRLLRVADDLLDVSTWQELLERARA